MKSEHLMALIFRVLGVLLGFQALVFIPVIGWTLVQAQTEGGDLGALVAPQAAGFAFSVAGAYVLFRHARWLARRAVPGDEALDCGEMSLEDADSEPVLRLFLRVAGAFAVAWALPELAGHGLGRIAMYQFTHYHVWTEMAPGAVKLAIGLYLLKGGPHLLRFAYGVGPSGRGEPVR